MVLLFATVNRVSLPILAMKLLPIPAFTSEVSRICGITQFSDTQSTFVVFMGSKAY